MNYLTDIGAEPVSADPTLNAAQLGVESEKPGAENSFRCSTS